MEGFAVFYPANRVSSVDLTGGAPKTAAGVGIGTGAGKARAAYPPPPMTRRLRERRSRSGSLDRRPDSPKMTLVIDPDPHRVSEISISFPNICE